MNDIFNDLIKEQTGLEYRVARTETKETSGGFTSGAVPWSNTNGNLTQNAANLFWDNNNIRLGIGTNAPAARLHARVTSVTSEIVARFQVTSASGNTLLSLYNDDNTISSGSNWMVAQSAATTYLQSRGDGFFFARGPVTFGDTAPFVPTRARLFVYSTDYYGIRVAASSVGGLNLQGVLTTTTSFDRVWLGHNAIWDEGAALWQVEAIGANDFSGILIRNGGTISFITAPSTGSTSRTFTHANFLLNVRMQLSNTGNLAVSGTGSGLAFADRTGSENWQWYGSSSIARLYNGSADVLQVTNASTLNLIGASRSIQMAGTQVVGVRVTGWGTPTATLSRTAITNADTLAQTISHLAALVTDLRAHGLIGT